jgi:hypothetical protein
MKTYELLDSPSKWTKEYVARDANGYPTQPLNEEAVSWCMMGAITKCYSYTDEAMTVTDKIAKSIRELNNLKAERISVYNDTHTYEEVIQVLKNADV